MTLYRKKSIFNCVTRNKETAIPVFSKPQLLSQNKQLYCIK